MPFCPRFPRFLLALAAVLAFILPGCAPGASGLKLPDVVVIQAPPPTTPQVTQEVTPQVAPDVSTAIAQATDPPPLSEEEAFMTDVPIVEPAWRAPAPAGPKGTPTPQPVMGQAGDVRQKGIAPGGIVAAPSLPLPSPSPAPDNP